MKRIVALLACLALAALPARADFGVGNGLAGFWVGGAKTPITAVYTNCISDSSSPYSQTFSPSGVSDSESVYVIVAAMGSDNASVFTSSSVTVDGSAATKVKDEGATGGLTDATLWAIGPITGAASLTVASTWSESLSNGVAMCVWVLRNATSATAVSTNSGSGAAGAAVTLDLTTVNGGYAVGVCDEHNNATTTWTGLTERQDTVGVPTSAFDSGTTADLQTTGTSLSITCDMSGSNGVSGVSAAFQ